MSDPTDVKKLLRLKRYEKPSEEFLDRFMSDFQTRQRSEMLRQSAHGLFFERLSTWTWDMGRWKWVCAGGAASAMALTGTMFLKPDTAAVAAQFQGDNMAVHQTDSATPESPVTPASTEEVKPILTGSVKTLVD